MFRKSLLALAGIAAIATATPAAATDDALEYWFEPSFEFDLDDDTSAEIATAFRFRDFENDGRSDTYYVRGWLKQKLSDSITVAGGAEYRENSPGNNEKRLLQQVSGSYGILRSRVRLEERFVDGNDGRMGLRLRTRLGVSGDLTEDGRWGAQANTEMFWTIRSNSDGGQDGLTGVRTQIGVSYQINDTFDLSLSYLREQSLRDNREDRVSHVPLVSLDVSL